MKNLILSMFISYTLSLLISCDNYPITDYNVSLMTEIKDDTVADDDIVLDDDIVSDEVIVVLDDATDGIIALNDLSFSVEEVSGTTTILSDGSSLWVSTDGQVLLRAEMADTLDGFTFSVGEVTSGDRISAFISLEDNCENKTQFVMWAEVDGNTQGLLYACDYLNGTCAIDENSCEVSNGAGGLREGANLGLWIDEEGIVYQSFEMFKSLSNTNGYVDIGALKTKTYGILIIASDTIMEVKLSDIAMSLASAQDFSQTMATGSCADTTAISCDVSSGG